jgi:hypothetical protein
VIQFERVAWVPSTPHTDHVTTGHTATAPVTTPRAIELAVTWVERQCAQQGAGAILVTATGEEPPLALALTDSACRFQHTTARRRGTDHLARGVGPVLAYAPDADSLDYAMSLACGSSLAVVERATFPLHGWAREVGAVDLTRPDDHLTGHDPQLAQAIDALAFYARHPPQFDRQAHRILDGLCDLDLLDRDALIGAVAAHGVSPSGLRRLAALADTVAARWRPGTPARSAIA